MEEQLGIVGIKMVFDIHIFCNYITKGGGVYGEQQVTKNRALRYAKIKFETFRNHLANFDILRMIQQICCNPPKDRTSKAKPC